MTRVLVVSLDRVGASMAGPGIRSFHFAEELGRRFDVTLAVPQPADVGPKGVEVVGPLRDERAFRRFAAGFDCVIAQRLGPRTMVHLARKGTRTIYDLYVPFPIENLGFFAGQGGGPARSLEYRMSGYLNEVALVVGDAFVCASDRQRDFWLGSLGVLGRLDVDTYAADPGLSSLVRVVPFGLDATPPRPSAPVLKGVVPGIRVSDRVLLWGGGIWNWFDPLTLIRAVGVLAEHRDDVKLYFLGVRHPNPVIEEMRMTGEAVALSKELGLFDRSVFFNFGWVPYEERQSYLLEADLGVSTHFDNAETRFAFRTRLLDYLWAELPIVTTRGDVLGDLVAERGLGRTVEPGDVHGLAAAIAALLDDEGAHDVARRNIGAIRETFAWPRVVEPLAGLVEGTSSGSRPGAAAVAAHGGYQLLAARREFRLGRALGGYRGYRRRRRG